MKSTLKKIPFYAFLFPILAVLMLAASNLGQIVIEVIIRPLIFSILAAVVIFLIVWRISKSVSRAGLFTFTFMIFLLTYGHIYGLLEDRTIGKWVIGNHRTLLAFWAVSFFIAGYIVLFRLRKDRAELTIILNTVTAIMVIFQVGQILTYEINAKIIEKRTGTDQAQTLLQPENPNQMPDVYFIILDKYGRSDAIKSYYDYDNSEFLKELRDLGFWVAECSRSNYAFTVMSFSSQLNMAYVEELTDEPSLSTTRALIRNNLVHAAFEEIGYTTIAFEMGFSWGDMKHFDYYFEESPENIKTWSLDPFEILYLKSTLGILFFETDSEIGLQVSLSDVEEKANRTCLILDVLPEIPKMRGPKFVHAHIITPHPPYIFNADGSLNNNPDDVDPIEGYREQLRFIEPRIIEVLRLIIENSSQPPVIILEGDHGFGRKYVTSNLLALYLPENGAEGLSDHLTLINVFPHIFNTYFGTDLDYLPDLSFTHTDDWYESVPLEEWNPDCRLP